MMGGETRRIGPSPSPGPPEVLVEGRELYFTPEEVRIGAGETANLSFVNEEHMFHTLTVSELGIDLRARPGDRVAAALVSPDPGRYEFTCTVSRSRGCRYAGRDRGLGKRSGDLTLNAP